jgi:hypothetical protein
VQWNSTQLEQVKYFKQNDEPSAPGLSIQEVMEIQKRLADVPSHMIPSALSRIEMKLDRELLEKQKNEQSRLRNQLEAMRPLTRYSRQLLGKFASLSNCFVQLCKYRRISTLKSKALKLRLKNKEKRISFHFTVRPASKFLLIPSRS